MALSPKSGELSLKKKNWESLQLCWSEVGVPTGAMMEQLDSLKDPGNEKTMGAL